MFLKILLQPLFRHVKPPTRFESRSFKVSVIGAAGNVGAPTMMLLKMNPLITKLIGIDKHPSILNVASDLSQLNFPAKVSGYISTGNVKNALYQSKLVIEVANSARVTPETTIEDMLTKNAFEVKTFAELISVACPEACFLIVTNPVNSMVPLFCKILENKKILNPSKVFGMCNLGSIRASSYIAELKGLDPRAVKCPIIGGLSSTTMIPVLSKVTPKIDFTTESVEILAKNIQKLENNLTDLKTPISTMTTAYATASLADSILRGLVGQPHITDCAFVKSNVCGTRYFASSMIFGRGGIERNLGVPQLSKFEKDLLQVCIGDLSKEIEKGESLA